MRDNGKRLLSPRLLIAVTAIVLLAALPAVAEGKPLMVVAACTVSAALLAFAANLWPRLVRWSQLTPTAAAEAMDTLAGEMRNQWQRFAVENQLRYPVDMPVRWRWTSLPVSGPISVAVGRVGVNPRFRSLDGVPASAPDDLVEGDLADLFRVYAGLDSGRMVVLGEAGSGKTAAAVRLALDALAHRAGLAEAQRAVTPVPVLLTPHGWNPRKLDFEKWLVDRIADEFGAHPTLRRRTVVRQLLQDGKIALFLDGFDDLPIPSRRVAIDAINHRSTIRTVIMSRSDDYRDTVADVHLRGAAVLELQPLSGNDVITYLRRCQVNPPPEEWASLLDRLSDNPPGPLMQALTSPLMLTVARDADAFPTAVRAASFTDRAAAENFLLDLLVPTAYSRSNLDDEVPSAEQVTRTLGFLARRLDRNGLREFGWWEVVSLLAWPHRFVNAVCSTGVTLAALSASLLGALSSSPTDAAVVFAVGLLAFSFALEPPGGARRRARVGTRSGVGPRRPTRFRWRVLVSGDRWREASLKDVRQAALWGLAAGLLLGAVAWYESTRDAQDTVLGPRSPRNIVGELLIFELVGAFVGSIAALALPAFIIVLNGTFGSLLDAFSAPIADDGGHLSPMESWRLDRRDDLTTNAAAAAAILAVLVVSGLVFPDSVRVTSVKLLFAQLFLAGIAVLVLSELLSLRWRARVAFVQIRILSRSRTGGMRLLEDARNRGILRVVGSRYQFRHARLQERMAELTARTAHTPRTLERENAGH